MTVEIVVTWTGAFNSWSRLFDCGNGGGVNNQGSDNIKMNTGGAHVSSSNLDWIVVQGATSVACACSSAVTLGLRYHVLTTIGGSFMRTYLNGVMKSESVAGWEPATMARSRCYIGKSLNANDAYFSGEIAYLKIYSGAMSQAEVTVAFQASVVTLAYSWNFAAAANDDIVDSTFGVIATLTNGAASDRTATGITLDGVDSHLRLEFDASAIVLGGAMTIEMMVIWNAFNFRSPIFDCGNGQQDSFAVTNVDSLGALGWYVFRGSESKTTRTETAGQELSVELAIGQRYHIVATVAGTTMRSYIDGVMKSESTVGWEPISMVRTDCTLGKSNGGDGYFNGEISSFRYYTNAMTAAEVAATFEAAFHRIHFFWNFAAAASDVVVDSVGGISAILRSDNGGTMPVRTATGIILAGSGPDTLDTHAGGFVELALGSSVVLGGAMAVEMVVMFKSAFNFYQRLFECAVSADPNALPSSSSINIATVANSTRTILYSEHFNQVLLNADGTALQWAHTTGLSDGMHYDLAQPLGLKAPTGYTVVLKNVGENKEYDTGLELVSDVHALLVSTGNVDGKGYGGLFYMYGSNIWDHWATTFVAYAKPPVNTATSGEFIYLPLHFVRILLTI